ncbi:MAG: hypothetical protein FIB08_12245 [Candidatus Methanoperedens sp.]|nr:hypothetical protein [Candidatus Methanoperedens sp.]
MTFLRSDKAEAEVVGHMIILGLTLTGIAMIMLVGVPTINSMEEMAKVRNAEQMYTVFDSRASKVALGDAPVQVIKLDTAGGRIDVVSNLSSDESYVLFELKNITGTTTNIKIPMGKITYMMGDREVAYEGGGVWSKYPEGSVMLSPPEFNYNGFTMTFPVINISGSSSVAGKGGTSLKIEKKGVPQMIYPNATFQNPVSENITQISITIKSEYYDAWADYFRSKTLVKVNPVPDEKKVTVTLETLPVAMNFSFGALASGEIELKKRATTDSYNSSIGNYSVSKSGNGSIRATRKIKLKSDAVINGSAWSGEEIEEDGSNALITGAAYAPVIDSSLDVLGGKHIQSVEGWTVGSTTYLVQSKVNEYKSENNNTNASSGDCLSGTNNTKLDSSEWASDECTISSGNYYLTEFDIDNDDILRFDTSGGEVRIAVEINDVDIQNRANITVAGNRPVKLYIKKDLDIHNDAQINPTNNDNSELFQVISSSDDDIVLHDDSYFCGFIWAPEAKISVKNGAQVYGAMVGDQFELDEDQQMHYDESLQDIDTYLGPGMAVRYLYITRYDVTASVS